MHPHAPPPHDLPAAAPPVTVGSDPAAPPAILVEGLGKAYRIGMPAPPRARRGLKGTVAHAVGAPVRNFRKLARLDVAAAAAPDAPKIIAPGHADYVGPVRPAPDPSQWRCLGDIDLMAATARRPAVEHDLVWALRDVSFTVAKGEVVGVVGRNGAGKSTLLKVLSRITDPTVGRAEIRGRVCSLLEVGTGFHKELTGRENVYMNGTVLGMTRREIDAAFDEIVDFSGVEEFLDTPVKRYSSGMKVRLAFSVAAHLRPEILIVDEVLAVGDAEFQEKCLGKMQDVAAGGRTVLFVSHNLKAVKTLCTRAVVLSGGRVLWTGPVHEPPAEEDPAAGADPADAGEAAGEPDRPGVRKIPPGERLQYTEPTHAGGDAELDQVGPWLGRITRTTLRGENGVPRDVLPSGGRVRVRVQYELNVPHPELAVFLRILEVGDDGGNGAVRLLTTDHDAARAAGRAPENLGKPAGRHVAEVELPPNFLNRGDLFVQASLAVPGERTVALGPKMELRIGDADSYTREVVRHGRRGAVALPIPWTHASAETAPGGFDRQPTLFAPADYHPEELEPAPAGRAAA